MFYRYALLGWLLGLLANSSVCAGHLLGGEMTHHYLDRNGPAEAPFRYEVAVNLYTECGFTNTISQSNVTITFYDRATNLALPLLGNTLPVFTNVQGQATVVLPYASQTACLDQPSPAGCVNAPLGQRYVYITYRGIINLPPTSQGYYAAAFPGFLSAGIVNVANPFFTTAILANTLPPPALANHSPVFADVAVPIICTNDTTYLLNNAVDADGDRLTYRFASFNGRTFVGNQTALPGTDPTNQPVVTYAPGYSGLDPLGGGTGNFAALDSLTGLARYVVHASGGQYVVALDVREYRRIAGREVLIGLTRRQITLLALDCAPGPAPVVPAPTQYSVVAGTTLSVPVRATQAGGHALRLTVNSALLDGPGGHEATFDGDPGTVAPGAPTGTATARGTGGLVAGTLRYSPPCTASAATYDVALSVQDLSCAGRLGTGVYRIRVLPRLAPTAIAGDLSPCGAPATRAYTATGSNGPVRWRAVGGTIVGSPLANPVLVSWPGPGTYRLVARSHGTSPCAPDSVAAVVTVQAGAALSVSGNLTVCPGGSTTLSVAGPSPYTLTGGGTSLTGPGPFTVSPGQTTVYSVAGPAGSCAPQAQVVVTVLPGPAADAGPPVRQTTGGVPLALGAPPVAGYAYQWSPATGLSDPTSANPTLLPYNRTGLVQQQSYALAVTDLATGCTNRATVAVTVEPGTELLVYNVVTPNGDGRNDVLYIENVRSYPGSTLTVYDRWGRQVFTTTDYTNDTNSWGSNPDVAPGIYYYLFRPLRGPALKGWVEVIK